jgi:hypothetical protein
MSAAATTIEPTTQPAAAGQQTHTAHLLGLVRVLIDYAKSLAAAFQQPGAVTRLADHVRAFGTAEIALILARITSGLLRAEALQAKLIRIASQPVAEPKPVDASQPREPRVGPAARRPAEHPCLANMPSPERIAAEVSRRPIGAVIADICRDLGIMPDHPLWEEISLVIVRFGGNLATLCHDIGQRLFPVNRSAPAQPAWSAEQLASAMAARGTGPP